MRKLAAIINPFNSLQLAARKEALARAGPDGLTVWELRGVRCEKDSTESYRRGKHVMEYLPGAIRSTRPYR
jgi:nitrogen regulatory protein PII